MFERSRDIGLALQPLYGGRRKEYMSIAIPRIAMMYPSKGPRRPNGSRGGSLARFFPPVGSASNCSIRIYSVEAVTRAASSRHGLRAAGTVDIRKSLHSLVARFNDGKAPVATLPAPLTAPVLSHRQHHPEASVASLTIAPRPAAMALRAEATSGPSPCRFASQLGSL